MGLPGIRRARPTTDPDLRQPQSAHLGRRLPTAQATAELITAQKDRVRAQFPDTPLAELKLLPAAYSNPHGRRAVTETHLTTRHRMWVKSLPPVLRADGTEYDKSKIIPYAYRHSYVISPALTG